MPQNRYHICVPSTDIVKVEKWSTASTEPDTLPDGKFNQEKITPKIQEIIKNPANLKDEQIQKVGEALFEALFDRDLREDFLSFYTEVVKKKKQPLQVILEINEIAMPEVVAYPWELMCLPDKYNQGDIHFATDRKLSFFRCRYQLKEEAKQPIKLNEGEPLKIALVVSKPTSDPDLNNVEFREVSEYLKSLNDKPENKVNFLPLMVSKNFSNIVERLEEDAPDIFHFIGHGQLIEKNGEDIGQIAFVNDAGKADWKDAKMFSQLFSGHTPNIVILQACETGKQSETNAFSSVAFRLMLQGIPVVIAMQYKVSNQTATTFVKEFYSQIIKGDSVEVAVQKSRSKLAMDNGYEKRDFAIPVIYMNSLDGCLFSEPEPVSDSVSDSEKPVTPKELSIIRLNESDKKYLITEIQNKYLPKQDDFKNIFLINKTIFGNNFYIQLENEYNNFETRIIYLVDELIDTEKLNKFLEIIRDKYPSFANKI